MILLLFPKADERPTRLVRLTATSISGSIGPRRTVRGDKAALTDGAPAAAGTGGGAADQMETR